MKHLAEVVFAPLAEERIAIVALVQRDENSPLDLSAKLLKLSISLSSVRFAKDLLCPDQIILKQFIRRHGPGWVRFSLKVSRLRRRWWGLGV